MSTIAQPTLRRARAGRSAFTGGVLWIVLVAALLAGVVATAIILGGRPTSNPAVDREEGAPIGWREER